MNTISISNGQETSVNSDIFEKYGALTWTAQKRSRGFHVARYFGTKYVYLHQLILEAPEGFEVHHIDGNGLNNLRENLELVTRARHRQSDLHLRADNTSGFRGVWYHKQMDCWAAEIMAQGKKIHLGLFDDPKEAAHARDAKARELGWPESGMNFPL